MEDSPGPGDDIIPEGFDREAYIERAFRSMILLERDEVVELAGMTNRCLGKDFIRHGARTLVECNHEAERRVLEIL